MKRKDAIIYLRLAGYHGDRAAFIRLYVENHVSKKAAEEAYEGGVKAKAAGRPCACHKCQNKGATT